MPTHEQVKLPNGEISRYTASTLEQGFTRNLRSQLKMNLGLATLTPDGRLVRESLPRVFRDQVLLVNFTRYDVLNERTYVALLGDAGLPLNPYGPRDNASYEDARHWVDAWHWVDKESDYRDYRTAILEKINAEKMGRSFEQSFLALTDPHHYSRKVAVATWPELYEFVLLDKVDIFGVNGDSQPEALDNRGSLGNYHGQRPTIYGSVSVSARIDDLGGGTVTGGVGSLQLSFPKMDHRVSRAYLNAYGLGGEKRMNPDTVSHEFRVKPVHMPIFPDIESQDGIMTEVVRFVKGLTR